MARKVRQLMDAGTVILEWTFVGGLAVFLGGWLWQRRTLGAVLRGEVEDRGEVVAPYGPPGAGPPPLPEGGEREAGVACAFYNRFDLPLVVLVVLIYFSQVALAARMAATPEALEISSAGLILAIATQLILGGMVTAFVAWRVNPVNWLGLRWTQWKRVVLIAPLVVFAMWGLLVLLQVSGYNDWIAGLTGDGTQETVTLFQETEDPLVLVLVSLLAVVVAPVTEEVLFRGYLYPFAKRFAGRVPAVLFSSLIFAAAHNNAAALLPLFVLAVVLVLVYERTGSIWAPIACHALFNSATVVMQLLIRVGVIEMPPG